MANIRTVSLTGSEKKISITGRNVWVRNDSASIVYASRAPGIAAGADGVVSIPAGGSAPVFGADGAVYLLGTGLAQLIGCDYNANPFKSSASTGGSGADDVARAAINSHEQNNDVHITTAERVIWNAKADMSDLPESLPANGGNADTAMYHMQYYLGTGIDVLEYTLNNVPDMSVFRCGITNCPSCPTDFGYPENDNDFYYQINRFTPAYANIQAFDVRSSNIFINTLIGGLWSGWAKISDGGTALAIKDAGSTAAISINYSSEPLTTADTLAAFDASDPQNISLSALSLTTLAELLPTVSSSVVSSYLGSHPAEDYVLRSEYDTLAERVKTLEGK